MECHDCHSTGFTVDELSAHAGTERCQIGISTRALRDHVKFDECELGLMIEPAEDPRIGKLEDRIKELERVARLALASGNVQPPTGELDGGHDEPPALPPPKAKKGGKTNGD